MVTGKAMGLIQACSTFFTLGPHWMDRPRHVLIVYHRKPSHASGLQTSVDISLARENHTVKPKLRDIKVHSAMMRPIIHYLPLSLYKRKARNSISFWESEDQKVKSQMHRDAIAPLSPTHSLFMTSMATLYLGYWSSKRTPSTAASTFCSPEHGLLALIVGTDHSPHCMSLPCVPMQRLFTPATQELGQTSQAAQPPQECSHFRHQL